MTLFLMDDSVRAQLSEIKQFAEANRYDLEFMAKRYQDQQAGREVADFPVGHMVMLPTGFGVSFTIEEHPGGWMRHVSVSSPDPNKVPIPAALEFVMSELGYGLPFKDCIAWPEETLNRVAINVLEPLPPENKLAIN